jgi:hypothetical protein
VLGGLGLLWRAVRVKPGGGPTRRRKGWEARGRQEGERGGVSVKPRENRRKKKKIALENFFSIEKYTSIHRPHKEKGLIHQRGSNKSKNGTDAQHMWPPHILNIYTELRGNAHTWCGRSGKAILLSKKNRARPKPKK